MAATSKRRGADFELPVGAIDMQVHSGPDVVDRPVDDLDLARACLGAGMAGAVLKSHSEPTASRACIATRAVPGVRMYGGIVLNRAVGGLNPDAVEAMATGSAGHGRIVWLPTRDAAHERARKQRQGQVVLVTDQGAPVDGLGAVFEVVAEHDLVLASGHVSPGEAFAVFSAARDAGCRRLLVTHATAPISDYTEGELTQMLEIGAHIEFSARNLFSSRSDGTNAVDPGKVTRMSQAIRLVGADLSILSSDLGDSRYPLPAEGLRLGAKALVESGLPVAWLDRLLRVQPARILAN